MCFSAQDTLEFEAERAEVGRSGNTPEIAGPFFTAQIPDVSRGISPDLAAVFGGNANKVLEACARLSGGHPRCAATIGNCLQPEDPGSTQYNWAALVQRLYPKVSGTYPAAWVLTAQDMLRLLSPSYLATLGRQKVDEWVFQGVLTPEGPDQHVLPLIMLLPFVLNGSQAFGGVAYCLHPRAGKL
jgi:hypothetical protein